MLKSKRMEVEPEKGESFLKGTVRKAENLNLFFKIYFFKVDISFIRHYMDGQHRKHWTIQQKLLLSILLMIKIFSLFNKSKFSLMSL